MSLRIISIIMVISKSAFLAGYLIKYNSIFNLLQETTMFTSNTDVSFEITNEFIDACSDQQVGDLEIEWTPELEALVQSWEKPVDEEDCDVGETNKWFNLFPQGNDNERNLSTLVEMFELQERMVKGMNMINAATANKELALSYYVKAKEAGVSYDRRGILFHNYESWKNRVQVLWENWKSLKEKCAAIATPYLWAMFFKVKEGENSIYLVNAFEQLSKEEFTRWGAGHETENIDDQFIEGSEIYLTAEDMLNDLEESHEREMKAYDRDVKIDWSFQNARMARRMSVQAAAIALTNESNKSLDAMIDNMF